MTGTKLKDNTLDLSNKNVALDFLVTQLKSAILNLNWHILWKLSDKAADEKRFVEDIETNWSPFTCLHGLPENMYGVSIFTNPFRTEDTIKWNQSMLRITILFYQFKETKYGRGLNCEKWSTDIFVVKHDDKYQLLSKISPFYQE